MKPRLARLGRALHRLKDDQLFRSLRHGRVSGARISFGPDTLINLCSNDYLGMPVSDIPAMQMQSSSRLVSGNDNSYEQLEKRLARHRSCQAGLVYPTGYMANIGTIGALVQKTDTILSDELNHASIIESCRLAGAKLQIYSHNDMDDLRAKLQGSKNPFIITEGIFSMDGDYARLRQIAELAEKVDAITVVDDAHGDFVAGTDGRGTPSMMRVSKKIDVHISSLSKGLGSFGGYAASQNNVINTCINRSKAFIYTSALPSALVEHSLIRMNTDREPYRKRLARNVRQMSAGLEAAGYDIQSKTHIIPIIIGSERTALRMGRYLYRNGIFAQPIRYPTVPRNSARLRLTMTGWLASTDIEEAVRVLESAAKKFHIAH